MYTRLSSQSALIFTIGWLLSGCQGGPIESPSSTTVLESPRDSSDTEKFATPEMLVMRSRSSLSPEREQYLLKAADAYYALGRIDSGDQLVAEVQPNFQMDLNLRAKWVILRSKMAIRQRDWSRLEKMVINDEFGTITEMPLLDSTLQRELIELRAQLYEGTSRHMDAIQERIYLHPSLEDNEAKQANNDHIWTNLQRLPNDKTSNNDQLSIPRDGMLSGWMQLAQSIQQYPGSIAGQQNAIRRWVDRWRDHPGRMHLPTSLRLLLDFKPANVQRIAALLPQSGQHEQIANAIQKGIVASYYTVDDPAQSRPEVIMYDTASASSIDEVYDRAVAEGADFIIGPLDKDKVEQLSQRESLPVPTLALNYTANPETDKLPNNLYQFGLRAEDEIKQMAEHAQSQGFKRAMVLTPKNAWGDRLAAYFGSYWQENGGKLLGSFSYGKGPAIGETVQDLLDIPESRRRFARIKSATGEDVNFRPRRREDIDVIFTIASPVDARLIKPQLEYYYASEVPMYSTSHVFDDSDSGQGNKDVEKVVFCEMPWVLGGVFDVKSKFLQQWPDFPSNLRQFAALGVDAYQLHQIIQALDISPSLELKGATGTLYIKQNRAITRRLPIFVFEKGLPVPFAPTPVAASAQPTEPS